MHVDIDFDKNNPPVDKNVGFYMSKIVGFVVAISIILGVTYILAGSKGRGSFIRHSAEDTMSRFGAGIAILIILALIVSYFEYKDKDRESKEVNKYPKPKYTRYNKYERKA